MPPIKLYPFQKKFKLIIKIIRYCFSFLSLYGILYIYMQVSPSGMASASQADFGGSDSRHLLQMRQALFVLAFFSKIKEVEIIS